MAGVLSQKGNQSQFKKHVAKTAASLTLHAVWRVRELGSAKRDEKGNVETRIMNRRCVQENKSSNLTVYV